MPRLFPSQVEEKKGGGFFTFLVFNQVTSRHSGSYTCVASNSAASVNYTAQLLVKGQFPNLVQREKCDTKLTVNFHYVTNQKMRINKIYFILFSFIIYYYSPTYFGRFCGGAVGWRTALQVGRSRVRFPMVSLEFFIDIILLAALWTWGRLSL